VRPSGGKREPKEGDFAPEKKEPLRASKLFHGGERKITNRLSNEVWEKKGEVRKVEKQEKKPCCAGRKLHRLVMPGRDKKGIWVVRTALRTGMGGRREQVHESVRALEGEIKLRRVSSSSEANPGGNSLEKKRDKTGKKGKGGCLGRLTWNARFVGCRPSI